MLRNQREERLKFVRREYKRYDEVYDVATEPHYIELEEPQFAGWEVCVDLSESGKRRRDAPEIMFLLNLFNMNKPHLIRNLTVIRVIRRNRYSYSKVRVSKRKFLDKYKMDKFYNIGGIHRSVYNRLPEYYKSFFVENKQTYFWYGRYDYYLRYGALPHYELVFRLKKSYWTHVKVYDGDAQGEAKRLRDKLYRGSYLSDIAKADGWNHCNYRDDFGSAIKCAWRTAIGGYIGAANGLGVTHEDWDDIEEDINKRAGVHNFTLFGYD